MNSRQLKLGLENCVRYPPRVLSTGRVGLLANQASVDSQWRYSWDVLQHHFPGHVRAIFSPQHGLWCEQQANMIETEHTTHAELQLPIYSLYSETRRPTAEMLQGLDGLVIDLQDVGTRVYTFAWTVWQCLEACRERGLPVVLLDRPNPLGGHGIRGPVLDAEYASFVGGHPIPMQHGLSLGELARLMVRERQLDLDLEVVAMTHWRRNDVWETLGRTWVSPSPNLPTWASVRVYPGQVLLEGTNLSEGRGTTVPFECCGAPWIEPVRFADRLDSVQLDGVVFRPLRFRPTFDKYAGLSCGGVAIHISDASVFRAYDTSLAIIGCAAELYPQEFAWLPPPYEYETRRLPIDILSGSDSLRNTVRPGATWDREQIEGLSCVDEQVWWNRADGALLYGSDDRPRRGK